MGTRLAVCRGQEVPEVVQNGWAAYLALKGEHQTQVWRIVVAGILVPDDPSNPALVEAFVQNDEVPTDRAASILQSCGFILTQACALDITKEALANDLRLLSNGEPDGAQLTLAVFESERQRIRETLLRQTLTDHGNVLVSLDWRVDQVSASNRGSNLEAPVVFLTLKYLNGDEQRRLSLQVTPEGLQDLRRFLAQFD
ncbi:MAG: COMM domain-containing protein [Candidatus Eisenbacteria bacterium]